MKRRQFIKALALVSSALTFGLPVLAFTKRPSMLYGDGVHDDTQAIQDLADGLPVVWAHDGSPVDRGLRDHTFLVRDTVDLSRCQDFSIYNCTIDGGGTGGIRFMGEDSRLFTVGK